MVHVQHHRLRALEQDAPPGAAGLVQPLPHRLGERQQLRGEGQQPVEQIALLEGRGAEAAQQRVVMQQQLVELVGQRLRLGEVGDPDGAARHLVLVGGADAAPGGADLAVAARRLARAVQRRVQRQDQRRIVGDAQRLRRDGESLRLHALDLGQQRLRVDHHAVADDAEFFAHQPARQQRELVGLVADHQRVAGVVAALEAHHDVGAAGQPIDDFALALVAPLRADHRDVRHHTTSNEGPASTWLQPSRRASAAASATASSPTTVA